MAMKNEAIFNIAYFVIMFVFAQSLVVSIQIITGQSNDGLLDNVDLQQFQRVVDQKAKYDLSKFNTSSWSLKDGIQEDQGVVSQLIGMTTNVQGYVYNMAEIIYAFIVIIFSIQSAQIEIFLIPAKWAFSIMGVNTQIFTLFSDFLTIGVFLLIFLYIIRFFVGFTRGY